MTLGTQVDLGQSHTVLVGSSDPSAEGGFSTGGKLEKSYMSAYNVDIDKLSSVSCSL